jgi:hypothetical protein
MTVAENKRYVTRREGVEMARAAGVPLSVSRVHKDTSLGVGPTPAGRYGPQYLYEASEFLKYAQRRAGIVVEETTAA